MAAYAALVSLMHIIGQIQCHSHPPIFLDKEQVESLTEKVTFLEEFLESYSHCSSNEADALEMLIADAAYAAEDIIESHIVDQIHAGSTNNTEESRPGEEMIISGAEISSIDLYQGLQKVIENMDSIKKEVMEIEEKMEVQHQLHWSSSISAGSLRSPSTGQNNAMVAFDDVLHEMMEKLLESKPNHPIIPIVGMGGIGKTTLAKNIYDNKLVLYHFDIRAWVTISQEYRMREILLKLLQESGENLSQVDEYELGEKLHKKLSGQRYLIIIDDIWNIDVWEQIKIFFPNNNNGSRIILTTRLSKLAFQVASSHGIEMSSLDETNSWNLFCKNVFGEEDCPPEIKEVGKKIVEKCKGLPLSIIVIGGLLARSEKTQLYWEYIAENLNSILNLEDNERCFHILYTSYNSLPVHLKPCFLYMGVYPEDSHIRVSQLIGLWVAEGFLRPIDGKSLEEVAEKYLEELIDRNLILVEECNSYGKIKFCRIHDLLRDLCLREARKEKFLFVLREQSQDINMKRRICIHQRRSEKEYPPQVIYALGSASLARSLIWQFQEPLPSFTSRLLRVSSTVDKDLYQEEHKGYEYSLEVIFQQVNLRYLASGEDANGFFPSSVSLLWNLQTLIIAGNSYLTIAPSEIWKMPQLRHVEVEGLCLPDPPSGHMDERDDIVLENLRTLSCIHEFKCDEERLRESPISRN